MSSTVCITGARFSPENEAILWTHAMARGYAANVWVPQGLVERLRLRERGHKPAGPVGINAANGRRFFYNLSQLVCTEQELREEVSLRFAPVPLGPVKCEPVFDAWHPLNTNGEPFPQSFADEVHARFGRHYAEGHSRYWATVDEAEFIFDSPFNSSFLKESNAVALPVTEGYPCVMYYSVRGTRRPDVFNPLTCRRYQPVNFYGRLYSPSVATQMKASAISYGCINSLIWLTTKRAHKHGIGVRSGVKPLTFCADGIFHLVNIAMTKDPARLSDLILSQMLPGLTDDDRLTIS
ncbi:uncharacterized protein Tco025E_05783 [Trypanosoma conorhini]|uniref:Uncharacterized protein n=1 Tax=Trypanosoma conorhini TaxID=83891 RepID=A0A422PAH5_9TRYP|nr:uncharacterized protein Tco025E_05783 [Trypanosoma conorhini]RNF14702.1 hypothetical protein Tco025E_05783 [Trypanosoma conorhini]